MMMENLRRWGPWQRDLVSHDFDRCLFEIGEILPELRVHSVASGTQIDSWVVPDHWMLLFGTISKDNRVLVDSRNHPLHVKRYSNSFQGELTSEELLKHVTVNVKHTPSNGQDAIPYTYDFYGDSWGFNIGKNDFAKLQEEGLYTVNLRTVKSPGEMNIGEYVLKGRSEDSIAIVSHLDHPCMANDGLSGVVVALEVCKRLAERKSKPHYTYRFIFTAETIGSIVYKHANRKGFDSIRYGVFLDMLGNLDGAITLQTSKRGNAVIDKAFGLLPSVDKVVPFRKSACNDEIVYDGVNLDKPFVSLSRWWPDQPEYHTSEDTPDRMSEEQLEEAVVTVIRAFDIMEEEASCRLVPVALFEGTPRLSKYGLWPDGNTRLIEDIETILLGMDGKTSVYEISLSTKIGYWETLKFVKQLEDVGLIKLEER